MDERTKKSTFLQLQLCTLLVVLTLMPKFSLMALVTGDSSASILSCLVRLVATIGAGLAFYAFYKELKDKIGLPVLICVGGGLALALITCIPSIIPGWVEWFPLIMLIAGLFLTRKALGIQFKVDVTMGVYIILLAMIMRYFFQIEDSICATLVAIAGWVLYLVGLGKFGKGLDAAGTAAVSKLKIAIWVGLAAAILGILIGWVPVVGFIIVGIVSIVAFIFEFLGYGELRQCQTIGTEGQVGASTLRTAMIIILVTTIVDFLLGWVPVLGTVIGWVATFLYIWAMWMMFKGWRSILYGLER